MSKATEKREFKGQDAIDLASQSQGGTYKLKTGVELGMFLAALGGRFF